uniref:Exported protein n=1 Tax=Rhabditophanes sp. KR3021 TaxID=114890 RepID=A0AC35TMX0_9BILA
MSIVNIVVATLIKIPILGFLCVTCSNLVGVKLKESFIKLKRTKSEMKVCTTDKNKQDRPNRHNSTNDKTIQTQSLFAMMSGSWLHDQKEKLSEFMDYLDKQIKVKRSNEVINQSMKALLKYFVLLQKLLIKYELIYTTNNNGSIFTERLDEISIEDFENISESECELRIFHCYNDVLLLPETWYWYVDNWILKHSSKEAIFLDKEGNEENAFEYFRDITNT